MVDKRTIVAKYLNVSIKVLLKGLDSDLGAYPWDLICYGYDTISGE